MIFERKSDWISGSYLENELKNTLPSLTQDQIKNYLKNYCKIYQEVYDFEQLESVFEYWELENDFSKDELNEIKELAKDGIDLGRNEYFESLNNVSEAVHILFSGVELTFEKVKEVLNYILYAHSCNETPEVFLERELEELSKLLKESANKKVN